MQLKSELKKAIVVAILFGLYGYLREPNTDRLHIYIIGGFIGAWIGSLIWHLSGRIAKKFAK